MTQTNTSRQKLAPTVITPEPNAESQEINTYFFFWEWYTLKNVDVQYTYNIRDKAAYTYIFLNFASIGCIEGSGA